MYKFNARFLAVCVFFAATASAQRERLTANLETPGKALPRSSTASAGASTSPEADAADKVDAGIRLATQVTVNATATKLTTLPVSTYHFGAADVLHSAGTFADLPRYLQTLPGLIGGSDSQNASFVRGGNSFENLFVVDHIEVPNINHLALANSTGGLVSMIDTEAIGTATFQSGNIDSMYQSHLSSLTEIHTMELPTNKTRMIDLGYSGAGIRINRPTGENSTLMFSARESVTNLFLKDVGLNGSPEFTNSLMKFVHDGSSINHLELMSLSGRDRLKVRPSGTDTLETNAFDTDYSGLRNTTGLVWQHGSFTSNAVGTLVLSNSYSKQNLNQVDQVKNKSLFLQNNVDNMLNIKYQYLAVSDSGSNLSFGADVHHTHTNYDTEQSALVYSPYIAAATPLPAVSLPIKLNLLDESAFAGMTNTLGKRATLQSGLRYESYGFTPAAVLHCSPTATIFNADGSIGTTTNVCNPKDTKSHQVLLPHASLSVLPFHWLNLRVGYAGGAQLPPYATILGAPGNNELGLIHSRQLVAGITTQIGRRFAFSAEAYQKNYNDYPVAKDIPQLSLATLLPTITDPFSTLTLVSAGKGIAKGMELSVEQRPWHHFFSQMNLSFSSAKFSGLDGVLRSGINDLPVVLNVTGGFEVKHFLITLRNTYSSGRPYTPFTSVSYKQNRMIYDLTQINALRGDEYNRLDFAVNRNVMVHGKVMRIHGGLINALNRENFYEYAWRARCNCGADKQAQIGLQPDFNISYIF